MDFSKHKDKNSSQVKSTFAAKVDFTVYTRYLDIKAAHKKAQCVPYLVNEIVEEMLKELTLQMEKDIAAKTKS
jgi:hypothetical protein